MRTLGSHSWTRPYYLDGFSPIVFSPDGRILATGDSGSLIQLWDWRRGRSLREFSIPKPRSGLAPQASGLAFSFDGQLLACCGGAYLRRNSIVYLLETATGNCSQTLDHKKTSVLCVAVSPNGRLLGSGGEDDNAVHIWDVLTGKELAQFSGHRGNIYCVAFSPDGKLMASGSADTTILLWDVSDLQPKPPATKAAPEELNRLWAEMKGGVTAAYPAIGTLSGAGEKVVVFLGQQLRPVPTPDGNQIPQWIADLDSEDFRKREVATTQLARLGEDAESALRQALQAKPTIEARKRLEDLLAHISPLPSGGEELRQVRAVHVLERIGSPSARDLLNKLAGGAPGATLTRNAKLALQRLERRAKQP